jgi:hypothetical protein
MDDSSSSDGLCTALAPLKLAHAEISRASSCAVRGGDADTPLAPSVTCPDV